MCVCACVCVCIRSSLHSVRFGQLLRCAHERIVNIMKVYIERNNMQVELIRFTKYFIHVYFCKARNFSTDALFSQHGQWICVIDRSCCATDGSVWSTDRAARLMDLCDRQIVLRDWWICVIDRSCCATDGSVWSTDRAARLMDLCDRQIVLRDWWICVIDRSCCATDGSVWSTDRAARLMDLCDRQIVLRDWWICVIDRSCCATDGSA